MEEFLEKIRLWAAHWASVTTKFEDVSSSNIYVD